MRVKLSAINDIVLVEHEPGMGLYISLEANDWAKPKVKSNIFQGGSFDPFGVVTVTHKVAGETPVTSKVFVKSSETARQLGRAFHKVADHLEEQILEKRIKEEEKTNERQ